MQTSLSSIQFSDDEEKVLALAASYFVFDFHGDIEAFNEFRMKNYPFMAEHMKDLTNAIRKVRDKCVSAQLP